MDYRSEKQKNRKIFRCILQKLIAVFFLWYFSFFFNEFVMLYNVEKDREIQIMIDGPTKNYLNNLIFFP